MRKILNSVDCSIYRLDSDSSPVEKIIASTPETRSILNDPFITGVKYTDMLRDACSRILLATRKEGLFNLMENETVVLHILRGGLNFGLREALATAFSWNEHASAFISAQRARKNHDPEEWYITESDYRKVYLPENVSLVFGDVVATGTSLRHALKDILRSVEEQNSQLNEIVFFTIGGNKAEEILSEIDEECRKRFPSYKKSLLIYLEGCFTVASSETGMRVKEDGTDLLRFGSLMAPEFLDSQYENPSYPLERCVIYDAGSRAFWLPEYHKDIKGYWEKILALAEDGLTFSQMLKERFPELCHSRFGEVDLIKIAARQVKKT